MTGRTADLVVMLVVGILLLTSTSGLRFKLREPMPQNIKDFQDDMRNYVQESLAELKSRPQMRELAQAQERTVEQPVETPMERLEKMRAELEKLERMQEPAEKDISAGYNYRKH